MKQEILTKLEELLNHADVNTAAAQVKQLQREYENAFSKEMEKAKQEFIDEGGKTRDFIYSKTVEDQQIISLFEKFRNLKKLEDERLAKEQQKNFEIKHQIISDINDLSKMETHVGGALKKLNELQTRWKETGNVSTHKYKELQAEYSKALEGFYYNLNIYRALQDHDLKRNFELKSVLLGKFKSLAENGNIKDVEQLVKTYRNEWDETGPVKQENWDNLKNEYRAILEQIYGKIKAHYKAQEEKLETNLSIKRALLEKAKAYTEVVPETEEEWKKNTDELIALQNEYKQAGRTDKSGDEVWRNFREVCDAFFERKKAFYALLKEKHAATKLKKLELIQKAEELKDTKEWKDTSDKIIRLQDSWKKLPLAGVEEYKLFARFRKACNTFFEAKRAFYDAQDAGYESNLKVKEEILARILAFTWSGDEQADRETLKKFGEEWNAAGLVPFKDKQRVNEAFYNKLDELYESLNINKAEKAMAKFRNKIERLSNSENAIALLRKESDFIRKQIEEISAGIRTYENNLGFFKNVKGKNSFMEEAEQKIASEKNRISELKDKLKLIQEALSAEVKE